jgi:hypothetical protein
MNIFVLDTNPELCAKYHCDKHLVKMITEHNQILGSIAYTSRGITRKSDITKAVTDSFIGFPRVHADGSPNPYGIGYKTHPCTQWAAASHLNYKWLCDLTLEMCKEYSRRYKKTHAGEDICEWYFTNAPFLPVTSMTPFAQAMPESCKVPGDAVSAYRKYYMEYKRRFARWKTGEPPWWKMNEQQGA